MGRAKIPRKSTNIDMTAMCDVAFLLLSFFIMATKQKPPEAVAVQAPSSVSSKVAPEKAILVTLTKEGKCFLILGDDTRKMDVLKDINTSKGLGLSEAELQKFKKLSFIGFPLGQAKAILSMNELPPADQLAGIPIADTANNEMVDWFRSITVAYANATRKELESMILIKGDNAAKYPIFKDIKYALKKNDIFKFRIVTNSETVQPGTELYEEHKLNGGISTEK
jgi:biopolymer transport protein ExbD